MAADAAKAAQASHGARIQCCTAQLQQIRPDLRQLDLASWIAERDDGSQGQPELSYEPAACCTGAQAGMQALQTSKTPTWCERSCRSCQQRRSRNGSLALDECSFCIGNNVPAYGYAPRGQRAVIPRPEPRGRRLSLLLLLCILPSGAIRHAFSSGTVRASMFAKFLSKNKTSSSPRGHRPRESEQGCM